MKKNPIIFILLFLLTVSISEAVDRNVYNASGTIKSPATSSSFIASATGLQLVNGEPPIGFTNATGAYIPVQATDGRKLPVDMSVAVTVGATTVNVSLPFRSALKTQTQALVDPNDVLYVNLASDTGGLTATVASITAKISEFMLQQATETLNVLAAIASTTGEVDSLAAQQATETDELLAAQASTTTKTEELRAQQATETLSVLAAVASVTDSVIDLESQQATETIDMLAAQASITSKVEELRAQQATEALNILAAQASTTAKAEELRAQQATETLSVLAAVASVTNAIISTPTVKIDGTIPGSTNAVVPVSILQGFYASTTLVIDASSTTKCPSLGTATKLLLWASSDCNFGGPDIIAGSYGSYIPGDCPMFVLTFATSTPELYFRPRVGSITLLLLKGN